MQTGAGFFKTNTINNKKCQNDRNTVEIDTKQDEGLCFGTYGLCRTWVMWPHWPPSLDPQSLEILSRGSRCRSSQSSKMENVQSFF